MIAAVEMMPGNVTADAQQARVIVLDLIEWHVPHNIPFLVCSDVIDVTHLSPRL